MYLMTSIFNKSIINVTKSAWKKVDLIIKKSSNVNGMIFSVKGGGCNGFNYNLSTVDNNTNLKKVSYVQDNINKIYVDPMAEIYLIGTTIDYIEEDFTKGIYESKFKFIPDKDKGSTCGCGVSFSPKF